MRLNFMLWFLPRLIVVALICLLAVPATAMDLYTYDSDSLAYQSTAIVEADLGGVDTDGGYPVMTATVTAVYKGDFKPGQRISLAALDFFRKANPDARFGYWYDTKPLASGDHVFLFLVRATKQFLYDIPATAEIYWPVFGGVKLVLKGQVLGFEQYNNPGPYVSDLPGPKEQGLDVFKAELSQSLSFAQRLAPLLKVGQGTKNVSALLRLLRKRVRQPGPRRGRDAIAEAVCMRLAALQNLPLLDQAAQIVAGFFEENILTQGFTTPQGRQYLLRKIADKGLPLDRRIRLTGMLRGVGLDWHPVPAEAQLITHVAYLAESNSDNETLCLALLGIVNDDANTISQLRAQNFPMPQIESDFQAALAVLNAFYRQTHSEQVRYQIEGIAADAGDEDYASLHTACGPILSIVSTALEQTSSGKTALNINYSLSTPLASETDAVPELVLTSMATQQETALPITSGLGAGPLQKGTQASGTDNIPLPPDLLRGVYRVFLRFREAGNVISTGHSCQVLL